MQRYKLSDNTIIYPGREFAAGGVQYGSNWREHMTDEQKAALGIVEVIDDPRPDERFYWVSENPEYPGKWIATPKDVDFIKAMMVSTIKNVVSSLLAQTDWMHMRALDGGQVVPEDVQTYRNAVRDHGNALQAEIEAMSAVADLEEWQQHDWPVDPRAPARPR